MTTVESLTLGGCTPTPLASYLKALGILRLISSDANHVSGQAADSNARGWWEDECFRVTTVLDRDSLLEFFLYEYAPSPIIAPWNGRAGFLEREHDVGTLAMRPKAERIVRMESSHATRFRSLRSTIKVLRQDKQIRRYNHLRTERKALEKELKDLTGDERRDAEDRKKELVELEKTVKGALLPDLRSTTGLQHLAFVDTCYGLATRNFPAPLLIGGGVDGSRDFGSDFIEALGELFDGDSGAPVNGVTAELSVALFGAAGRLNRRGSLGLFTPQQSGLKSTTGFEVGGDKEIYPLNSWDVVLAMEGMTMFAGASTRRWDATVEAHAAFPFTFQPTTASAAGLSAADPNHPRCEIWTPLWFKPARSLEILAVFSEGRLTLGYGSVQTGLDAARSVSLTGQARGISGFERYSLIQPDSKKPHQATPVGRFRVPERPHRDLTADLEEGDWLKRAQRFGNRRLAPTQFKLTMRRLEDALFQITEPTRAANGTTEALVALGRLVAWFTTNPRAREDLRPPPRLSSDWMKTADDASPEFRVAASLAGLGLRPPRHVEPLEEDGPTSVSATDRAMPMACHFAPVVGDRFVGDPHGIWTSETKPPDLVWGTRSLILNLIHVLERRLVDATMRGLHEKPVWGATYAGVHDVGAFLLGDFNDARCGALLAGLIWARPTRLPTNAPETFAPVPFAYAALKPIFTSDKTLRDIGAVAETARLPIPPEIVSRLRAGGTRCDGRMTDVVVRAALARARSSGMPSPFEFARSGGRRREVRAGRFGAGLSAARLAAALLIPVGGSVVKSLVDRAYPGVLTETNTESTEDMTNVT